MRVYISGPITGVDDYMENFNKAEKYLTSLGYDVINPAKVDAVLPEMSYEEYLNIDLYLLSQCKAIYLLDGWNRSNGARAEMNDALMMGIDIYLETEEMPSSSVLK